MVGRCDGQRHIANHACVYLLGDEFGHQCGHLHTYIHTLLPNFQMVQEGTEMSKYPHLSTSQAREMQTCTAKKNLFLNFLFLILIFLLQMNHYLNFIF